MKNEMANFFPFRNIKIFSFLKYEEFYFRTSSNIVQKIIFFLNWKVPASRAHSGSSGGNVCPEVPGVNPSDRPQESRIYSKAI